MRLGVLIAGGLPNPSSGGGALTVYTVVSHLLEQGHDVTVLALVETEYWDPAGQDAGERSEHLRSLGAKVEPIFTSASVTSGARVRMLGHLFRPLPNELFPHLRETGAVREAVERLDPDALFVYHFEALAASREVRHPRFAAVGDPPQLPALWRWRLAEKRLSPGTVIGGLWVLALLIHQPRLQRRLLRECQAQGAFAAHHAKSLGYDYLRTPVPDPGPQTRTRSEKPRILLIGHLRGIVTVDGLRVFAKMLPALERELGADGFEVRVVGGYDPPPELAEALSRPSIRLLGHLEDVADELNAAGVLLVPTSIPLGIRVRIITGWSYGTPIVTHSANARGTPEVEHGRNALVGGSPAELVAATLRVLRDDGLRARLEAGGRETYERSFAPPVAASAIERTLARISGARPGAASATPDATGAAPRS